ncbi:MAG: hypothetical protein GX589_00305 [Deltaproteobacteria bacterium]|nr:hypothetical protein [Deltaproteobacteria bacterium]
MRRKASFQSIAILIGCFAIIWGGLTSLQYTEAQEAHSPEGPISEGAVSPNPPVTIITTTTTTTTTTTPSTTSTTLPECIVYEGRLDRLGWDAGGTLTPEEAITGDALSLPCVQRFKDQVLNCANKFTKNQYWDDRVSVCVANLLLGGANSYEGVLPNGAKCTKVSSKKHEWWHHMEKITDKWCLEATWYFKEPSNPNGMCELVPYSDDYVICGNLIISYWMSTPISLIWEHGADIDAATSLVNFPLNPGQSGQWFAWKASAKTPLLVYDPKHQGRITSAQQLFGNWTFGGQRIASAGLSAIDAAPITGQPWQDGFEALATLDQDGSGRIEGRELEPLALWFDHNQNAVSEPGEVIPVLQLGISALYFDGQRSQAERDIYLSRGFDRVVNGRLESGVAVDWSAEYSPSKFSMLNHNLLQGWSPTASKLNHAQPQQQPTVTAAKKGGDGKNPFTGLWQWHFDDEKLAGDPPGYLALGGPEGVVRGYAIVARPIIKGPSPLWESVSNLFAVHGQSNVSADGIRQATFTSEFGRSTTSNHVELSADGMSMKGRTTAFISKDGKTKNLTYTWTAKKLG